MIDVSRRGAGWRLAALAALLCAAFAAGPARAGCEEGVPESCREDLARIEAAFQAGLAEAANPGDEFEAYRLRVVALGELVERTYESTLAWLADHDVLADRLEAEQGQWLRGFHQALADATAAGGMERLGDMLMDRLRVFYAATAEACPDGACYDRR